jgi:hypothetical protein
VPACVYACGIISNAIRVFDHDGGDQSDLHITQLDQHVPVQSLSATAALISASGVWGLTVARAGKSLVAALQISSAEQSNMLVSVDSLTGAVERLGATSDKFAGASIMGCILSVGGFLFIDTLDSSETTNTLFAFNASTGALLAAAVCPGIFNIMDFVAFQ